MRGSARWYDPQVSALEPEEETPEVGWPGGDVIMMTLAAASLITALACASPLVPVAVLVLSWRFPIALVIPVPGALQTALRWAEILALLIVILRVT